MTAYYNDSDRDAVHWLRCLVRAGLIPPGDIDDRSIADVQPDDLAGYLQVHLFAGIGGWAYALSLAKWPDDAQVWTGSCPCQPFSGAGKRLGENDERHLWPEMYRLVQECQPATVFGEQVASADGYRWLAGVRTDLEKSGYAVGAADLPAAGVAAPHKRQRLFWVAESECGGQSGVPIRQPQQEQAATEFGGGRRWVDGNGNGRHEGRPDHGCDDRDEPGAGSSRMGDAERGRRESGNEDKPQTDKPWEGCEAILGHDGKARQIKPGLEPLVDGVPGRVAQLRGLGNAIVPQVAAEFISAYMKVKHEHSRT